VATQIDLQVRDFFRRIRSADYDDDPEEQQHRSQMLSAILLMLLLLITAIILAHNLLFQSSDLSNFATSFMAVAGLFGLYRLSRTGHFRLSATLLLLFSFAILTVLILNMSIDDPLVVVSVIGMLNLPVLLSSNLLSLRWTVLSAGLNLVLTALLLTSHFPNLSSDVFYYLLRFNVIASVFILILTMARLYDRRRVIEQAHTLRANEARFRHLFEAISDPICVHQQDRITSVNPAFEKIFQYAQSEVVGKSILDFVESEARPLLESKKDSTHAERFEMRVLRKDGVLIPVELTSRAFEDNGQMLRVSVIRDMATRKQIEEIVEAERHLLRIVIDNIPDYIYVKDEQHRLVLANKALQERWGGSSLIGKNDHDLMAKEWADYYLAEEKYILSTGEAMINKQHYVPASDSVTGKDIWLLQTKIPLRDARGNIIGLVGINRDITNQKQMENRLNTERQLLRTVIDNIPDDIYVKNAQGQFLLVNRSMSKSYDEANLVGKTDYDFVPAIKAEQFQQDEQALFATGQAILNQEIYVGPEYGFEKKEAWLLVTKVPLRDSNGEITALVGINRDITHLKEAELRLESERNLLRTMIDHLPNEVFIKDLEHRFVLVNRAVIEHWNTDPTGKSDYDLSPNSAQQFIEEERRVLESGEPMLNQERGVITQNGDMYWFLSTKLPLRDHTGQITGLLGINVNITPLKQIQAALTEERNLLRAVTDNIPDRIYVKDREGRFVMANRSVRERWAAEGIDDVTGKTDFDLFPQDEAESYAVGDRQVVNTGQPIMNYEYKWINKAGEERWIVSSRLPLHDASGQITGLLGIIRDITERKRAELALIEERNLLSTVIENIPEHIYVKNREHKIILGNRALHQRWGRNVIGLSDDDLLPPERAKASFEMEEALMQSGEPMLNFANQADSTVDGKPLWLLINKVPLRDSEGRIVGLVGINRDVTEIKLAEIKAREERNLLRAVIDAVPDHIYVKDIEHRFVLVNEANRDLWPDIDVIGKSDYDLLPEALAEMLWQQEEEILRTGQPLLNLEVMSANNSVTPQWLMVSKVPLRDSEGRITGLVGVNRDITERRQAEQQRMELAVERERVKILQQVISDMSHDLKNPLANFRTSLYLLEKFIDQPTRRSDYLAALDSHTQRLEAMLDDLLSIARLEQATDEFHFEPVDIHELVVQLVEEQQTMATRRGHHLHFSGENESAMIRGDRLKLSRALTNLIVNAINYTPEGGDVRVGLRSEDGCIVIEVEDNGIGIKSQDQQMIFERFYRVDKARSSSTGGTGLGLSIARRIAEAHGGKITVKSEYGVGSLFSMWLPIVDSQ
jgi:PAS domain S-box-containing protein